MDATTRTDTTTPGTPTGRSRAGAAGATPAPLADRGGGDGGDHWTSSRRKVAFRVVSVLVSLLLLVMHVFGLLEVVLMWFPDQFLVDTFGGAGEEQYAGGIPIHRTHFMAVGLVSWTVVPAVLVQLRKPWRRTASMLVASIMVIAALVAFGLAGTLQEWLVEDVLMLAAPVLLLAALHPRARDLLRRPTFDTTMVRLALVAAVPWTVYGLMQARLQLLDRPGDVHAGGLEHWGVAFLLAVAIITTAVVGASDHDGWRLPAWTAALASIVFGVHSLAFPGLASGLPAIAAIGAVAWGGVYAVATVRRARAVAPEEVDAPAGPDVDGAALGLASGRSEGRA